MTVKELIEQLERLEDKTREVLIADTVSSQFRTVECIGCEGGLINPKPDAPIVVWPIPFQGKCV